MNILETLKGLFGEKKITNVSDVTNAVTVKVSDMASKAVESVINFDDINVSTITSVAEKFGIMDKLPEAVKAKLADGTLSNEDLKSFIPEIKELLMAKAGSAPEAHVCEENCAH